MTAIVLGRGGAVLRVLACLAGALALAGSFRHEAWSWLAFVALVPWLVVAGRRGARVAAVVAGVGLSTLVFYLAAGSWLAQQWGLAIFVIAWSWCALSMLPAPLAWTWLSRRGWPLLVVAPPAWVVLEFVRSRLMVGNLSLYLVGHSQAGHLALIQTAELWGEWGLSFLVIVVNAALADAWLAWRQPARERARFAPSPRAGLGIAFAALALSLAFGAWRLRSPEFVQGPRVALVQPVALHVPGVPAHGALVLGQQANLTMLAVPPGSVDLVAWPENSLLDFYGARRDVEAPLRLALAQVRADFLLSAFAPVPGRPDRAFNSVYQISPDGVVRARHDKLVLIPGTECVPFERPMRAVSARLANGWRAVVERLTGVRPIGVPGERVTVFELPTPDGVHRFGTPTCFENTHSGIARAAVRGGAGFLVNVTSEGLAGRAASEYMLRIARLRAIEFRVAVARAGNVGITAIIDPLGRYQDILTDASGETVGNRGVLVGRLQLWGAGRTLHARAGDWLPIACALALALLAFTRRRPGDRP